MQTVFPKIAAVLLTICAVAFMGLSIAAYYGRPDPLSEMMAPELDNYNFQTATTPETVSVTVTPIAGDNTSPKQHSNPYNAIVDAYQMESQRLGALTTQQNDLATQLSDRVTIVAAQQQQDVTALDERVTRLKGVVSALDSQRQADSKVLQDLMVETKAIRDETTDRRQDVTRLQNELEEIRTDTFRLKDIRRVLTDRLVRLQLENQALESRLKQVETLTGQSFTNN